MWLCGDLQKLSFISRQMLLKAIFCWWRRTVNMLYPTHIVKSGHDNSKVAISTWEAKNEDHWEKLEDAELQKLLDEDDTQKTTRRRIKCDSSKHHLTFESHEKGSKLGKMGAAWIGREAVRQNHFCNSLRKEWKKAVFSSNRDGGWKMES